MDATESVIVPQAQRVSSSQPAGFILSKFGLLAVLAMLVLAAWYNQIFIVILLALVLAAGGISAGWSRLALVGVRAQRILDENRVFPGEQIILKLRTENHKLLPLPWLQIEDEIPLGFTPDASKDANRPGYGTISKTSSLLWYSAVSWQTKLDCHSRGYYPLGPITITSGDIFGFYPRWIKELLSDYIIVYPRIYTLTQLGIPSLYPIGETRAEKRTFEDPSRIAGIRDYRPGDSLRRIHWKASARCQELQVKVFEPTTTLKAAIFLGIDTFLKENAYDESGAELGISTAASIANHLIESGSQAGIWVNSELADSAQPARLLPGGGDGQLVTILEALAKVTPIKSSSFIEFIQKERAGLPMGTTLIFVLSLLPAGLSGLLTDLCENGYKLLVVQIGDSEFNAPDIPHYRLRNPSDFEQIAGGRRT